MWTHFYHTVKLFSSGLNDQTVLFQTIQFSFSINFKDFYYFYAPRTIHLNFSHLFTQFNDQTILFQTIRFSMNIVVIYTQLNIKTLLFETIQFSLST